MNDHPEQAEAIRPYYEMLKFNDDTAAILGHSGLSTEEKMQIASAIGNLQITSNTMEEFQSKMESIVDSQEIDEAFRGRIDELLSKVEHLGYLRDATVIENRKQRKQREAEEAKKKEEEKNKVDEAVKNAADKKKVEDKDKQEDMGKVPGKNDNITNEEDVDIFSDEESSEEQNQENESTEEPIIEDNTVAPVTQNIGNILDDIR